MGTKALLKTSERAQLPGVFLMINSLETGGSERQFAAVANSLSPKLFRVQVACHVQRGNFLDGFGDITAFRMGGSLYRWKSIISRFRLARHLRKLDMQIAHAFDFYTNLSLIPGARLARVPVVIGSQRQLGDLLTAGQAKAQLAVFRWCDAVVCNSRAAADLLLAQGLHPQKIVVIGNGLPASAFAEAVPALPKAPGRTRVGMIARMNSASKNHKFFVHLAARLSGQHSAMDFVLVGDGPLRPELEREAERLGLGERVSFLGDRRDIPELLASLDISVLPSASESLSNVILESMAAGVPVVAARVGGNVELLDDAKGILVTQGNEEAFAHAVGALAGEPERRAEMGRAAKEFATANFSLDRMQLRYEQLYSELLYRKSWYGKANGPG